MNFTYKQQIKILKANGYTVKQEQREYYDENYKETFKGKVLQLYDADGNKIPYDFDNNKYDAQFDETFREVMTNLLLSISKQKL